MGSGAKNGFKRAVLAADNGCIYSLRKKAGIWPISDSVSGIRALYYDQTDSHHTAFSIASAGLLAIRQDSMGTSAQRQDAEQTISKINWMADGGKNTFAGNIGNFRRSDLYHAKERTSGHFTLDRIPLDHRIANAFVSYVKYIGKLVWPSDLAVFYPLSHLNLLNTTTVICAFIFILISAISIYIGRRKKYIAVGWLWFAGTLVPMIGLVQAGGQAMANRYMYLSMLGLLIIIALAGKELIATRPRLKIIAVVMSVILLSCLLVLTRMQVQHWRNSITLFEYTLSVTKDNASAENSYGCALFNEDRISEAERHFGNALRIDPGFDPALPNLARTYMKEGKYNEAIPVYEELIKRNYKNAELYYNLAMAFGMQEKYNDSIKYFNKSLELNPSDPDTHKQLGITLLAAGKT